MGRNALITGISGQDGTFLAEHLVRKGYNVYGAIHREPTEGPIWRELSQSIRIIRANLDDQASLTLAIDESQPDEIYNLGAITFVPASFDAAEATSNVNGLGVLRILEAIRVACGLTRVGDGGPRHDCPRFYQATSSEIFGNTTERPQSEDTPIDPKSPYGAAKAFGHHITKYYREAYGLFAVSGICFNHESERRREVFATRKITRAAARIKLGMDQRLALGNLDSVRDWGFAGDYVEAMHLLLQSPQPADYVIGTGVPTSVKGIAELAFGHVGLDWRQYTELDPTFRRVPEVDYLVADPTKIQKELGWRAALDVRSLIWRMVEADLKLASQR